MRVGDISFAIFLLICSSRIFLFLFLSFFGKIRRKTGKINFMLNDGVENSSSSFELNGIFFFFFFYKCTTIKFYFLHPFRRSRTQTPN